MEGMSKFVLLYAGVLAFYLVPWCPFLIAAYFASGWVKLLLAAMFCVGPMLQAVFLAAFHGSD